MHINRYPLYTLIESKVMNTGRQSLYVVPVQYEFSPSGSCLKGTLFKSEFGCFNIFLFFGRLLDLIMNYDEGEYGLVSCYIQVLQQQISLIIAP